MPYVILTQLHKQPLSFFPPPCSLFVCYFFVSAKIFSMERRKLYRELNGARGIGSSASFYGARSWIERLDLVAELSGHEGCINTLWYPPPLKPAA